MTARAPSDKMTSVIQARVGIIGGTGIGSRLAAMGGKVLHVPTPAGLMRGRLLNDIVLIQRHSVGHKTPPHLVNYEAFALGLQSMGVKACFATAAVGSLRADWGVGTLVAPRDVLDLSSRNATLFDRTVTHTAFADPLPARRHLLQEGVVDDGIYIGLNGPRYETPHEIRVLSKVGDLVGMTAASEAIVMREAGIDYGCLCIVTNLGCGMSDVAPNHEEVVDEMNRSGARAVEILLEAAKRVR